jgi:two-component system sensor histidine kinase YesM
MKKLLQLIRNLNIKTKLMLIFFGISFFPLAAMGTVFYMHASSLISTQEKSVSRNYLDSAVDAMDTQLAEIDNLSDYLSFNQVISNTFLQLDDDTYSLYETIENVIDPFLNSIMYFHNDIEQVTIYAENVLVRHDTTLAPLADLESEHTIAFESLSQDNQWFVDDANKQVCCVRKMPMLSKNGVQAVLYIQLNYDAIFSAFENSQFDDFFVRIQDESGNLLYSRLPQDCTQKQYENVLENGAFISSFSNITDWKASFAPIEQATSSRLVDMGIVTILFTFFFAWLTWYAIHLVTERVFVSRVKKLSNGMAQVEQGDLDVVIEPEYEDEIGSLTHSFMRMTQRLKVLIEEVYISKYKQKEYELSALQHQINPHFLYNTLSMINFQALQANQKDISKITLALSSFYRTSLNKGKSSCTLKEEISNIKSYLVIQSMMHDNNFEVQMEIDESLLEYETLNLILQPIVENAIEHGLDAIEDDRKKVLRIVLGQKEDLIQIFVEDNGIGMPEAAISSIISSNSSGYGMRNVHERIQLYYGPQYGLNITSQIGRGCRVEIIFPKRKRQNSQIETQ